MTSRKELVKNDECLPKIEFSLSISSVSVTGGTFRTCILRLRSRVTILD